MNHLKTVDDALKRVRRARRRSDDWRVTMSEVTAAAFVRDSPDKYSGRSVEKAQKLLDLAVEARNRGR